MLSDDLTLHMAWEALKRSPEPIYNGATEETGRCTASTWGDGICEIDLRRECFYVSPQWCELLAVEMQAMSLSDALWEHIDSHNMPVAKSALFQGLSAQGRGSAEFQVRGKTPLEWMRLRLWRVEPGDNSKLAGVLERLGGAENACRREALRRAFDRTFETAPAALSLVNLQSCVVAWNRDMEALTGWTKQEVLGGGLPFREKDVQQALAELLQHDADDSHGHSFCTDVADKQGMMHTVQVNMSRWAGDSGETLGAVLNLHDETEFRKDEIKLKQDIAAEATSGTVFLRRAVGHHVRQLLQGLIGNLDLLRDEPVASRRELYLADACMSARAISDLAVQLVAGNNVASEPAVAPPPVVFDVRRLLQGIVEHSKPEALRRGIALDIAVDTAVARYVQGGATRLQDLLSSLTLRVIESLDKGAVSITCGPETEAGSDVLVFAIEAEGVVSLGGGDTASNSQESLSEADTSEDSRLYACRLMAEELGGLLFTYSEANRVGARFEAVLPAAQEPHFAAPNPSASTRVLVVEDDNINQIVLCKQLARLGVECDVVGSGLEALRRIEDSPDLYAVILSDCRMPGMSGYELAARIRKNANPLVRTKPVIAMTGDVMPGDEAACREAGMDAYLTKPIGIDRMRSALGQWLPKLL